VVDTEAFTSKAADYTLVHKAFIATSSFKVIFKMEELFKKLNFRAIDQPSSAFEG